ncbi:Chemotaxis response regulator protein-glutamate methylesterase CheB [Rubellimicrobium mesophilum DSM 19309]|uniref:Protein-glutamate methylesterase/protein-glutamine glutaminase n=1 Tax=Rubellimicrobium mesophilum DSM 19309 TaxID=442562 RepID=A0A017HQD2_9RHOB|nr:chemotaxis response regulator protein-glutamate methylesterase [Rubellimicrobium mesophilum]EYD76546.1 Chemotaxis response regulator protein-glutamate methylesterase CheB [Rubellimicrobium mesophilum DSM 19309]
MTHTLPKDPIKVMIVDDSASIRRGLRMLLSADQDIEVIAAVADPFEAAEQMRKMVPDVMLLDIEMPRMDGLTFLGKIMAQRPLPVIICSSFSEAGSRTAMRALELGAAEVIGKPNLATSQERQEAQIRVCDAVRAAVQSRRATRRSAPRVLQPGPKHTADVVLPPPTPNAARVPRTAPLVAIGASTGGTEALATILKDLPPDAPPVVIVQHMPERFTMAFAQRLDGLCRVKVSEAASGDVLRPGLALIAPGDHHLLLRRVGSSYHVEVVDGPYVARHRPSVDVLFRSVAQAAGGNALGLLLTGMGDDGARGLLEMRQAGARTAAQDEATSVVFGMPREALRMGATDQALPLDRMAGEIVNWGRKNVAVDR